MKKVLVSVVLLNLLVACTSTKPPVAVEDSSSQGAGTQATTSNNSNTTTSGTSNTGSNVSQMSSGGKVDPLDDPNSPLAKRSVYFDYDASTVKSEDQATVTAHAGYLAGKSAQKTRVEGHADERGSNEYNLALGQRRADSVKKMLELGGAKDNQVESVSYGEEKPKATGHDESAWAQNRRVDINYAR